MTTRKTNYTKMRSNDYKTILKFYKMDTTKMTNKQIKEKAEHLLAVKLCKCIKSIPGPKQTTKSSDLIYWNKQIRNSSHFEHF